MVDDKLFGNVCIAPIFPCFSLNCLMNRKDDRQAV